MLFMQVLMMQKHCVISWKDAKFMRQFVRRIQSFYDILGREAKNIILAGEK